VNVGEGLPAFYMVGLPATVVKESRERVRAALLNSGFEFPAGRIIVNLAPADLPKEGGRFDLPIALGIAIASGQLKPGAEGATEQCEFYGELALSGELKSIKGLLIAAAHAAQVSHELVVPHANTDEACRVMRARVRGATNLLEVCAHVEGRHSLELADRGSAGGSPCQGRGEQDPGTRNRLDLRDIRGQEHAKRALTVAAAGGHSLLMVGVPGSGKSSLAQRLSALLPPLSEAQALEVAAVASVSAAGFDPRTFGIRPFRAPHHTASAASIIGGGSRARPGEISLAHHGVLFLDELPEFERRLLEALREPLETGEVAISRAAQQTQYPAVFQLIAAMNPCPCGYLGDERGACHCAPDAVQRYLQRISGPLLDRLDLQIDVPRVPTRELLETNGSGESSAAVAARVRIARELQIARQGICNARLNSADVARYCNPGKEGLQLAEKAADAFGLSARGYHRILKVARTIADLAGDAKPSKEHMGEAIFLRVRNSPRSGRSEELSLDLPVGDG
jgi:magnesium chelatase family protein